MSARRLAVAVVVLSSSLGACGGGGGGGGPGGTPPAAPTAVTAAAGSRQVTLRWSGPASATFDVYWAATSTVSKSTGTRIAGVTSPYVHAGLTAGTPYAYVVTAVAGGLESADSPRVGATPTYVLSGNALVSAPLVGATVTLYQLLSDGTLGAAVGAAATTDGLGAFTITLASAPAGPLVALTSGGTYVDEVTGAAVTLSGADGLSAVVPAGTTRLALTPLTLMATARARALAAAGAPVAAAVGASNAGASNAGAGRQLGVADVLDAPPAANNVLQCELATLDQRAYALVLAGLAHLASGASVRAIDLATALALDFADGTLDGLRSGSGIQVGASGPTLASLGGLSAIQGHITTFAASSLNHTQLGAQTIPTSAANVGVTGAGAAMWYVATAALPSWVSGQAGSAPVLASIPGVACTFSGLPGWLSASGCTLSGTAPVLGAGTTRSVSAPFTVTLSDGTSSLQVSLPVTVVQPAPALVLVSPAPGATVGQAYSRALVASVSGGTAPYSFRSDTFANGAPPPGMIVDLAGNLVGTPSLPGTYRFGVCAVDLVGQSRCGTTAVTVAAPPVPVTVATYAGTFSGSGTFSRPFPAWSTTCTFYDTFDGTITLTKQTVGGTTTSTVHVQGNFVSKALSGSTVNFTCLDTSTPWEDEEVVSISGAAVTWSTLFTTPGGTNVTGAFSGTAGPSAISGNMNVTMDTSTGSASMAVVLTGQ